MVRQGARIRRSPTKPGLGVDKVSGGRVVQRTIEQGGETKPTVTTPSPAQPLACHLPRLPEGSLQPNAERVIGEVTSTIQPVKTTIARLSDAQVTQDEL